MQIPRALDSELGNVRQGFAAVGKDIVVCFGNDLRIATPKSFGNRTLLRQLTRVAALRGRLHPKVERILAGRSPAAKELFVVFGQRPFADFRMVHLLRLSGGGERLG